jgi:hypothetical protein
MNLLIRALFICSISIVLVSNQLNAQILTVKGNQFYWLGQKFPMWGIRVASASQTDSLTNQLIGQLDDYKQNGINVVSVFVQGSSGGYCDPFLADGTQINQDHFRRLTQIIEACQSRSMVVIVGIFYQRAMQGSNPLRNINDSLAVFHAVETVAKKLIPYRNVIFNIANEQNSSLYRSFKPLNFNDPKNIINLCKHVKNADPERIVGGGGYNDTSNVAIGKSAYVDVLLFDTFSEDVQKGEHSGWHYDYFKKMGVPDKPIINVEIFGSWTAQFIPPGVFPEEGKKIHLQEITESRKRPGLYVHFHSNVWLQGISAGYPVRFELGGMGILQDPGIRWWFNALNK